MTSKVRTWLQKWLGSLSRAWKAAKSFVGSWLAAACPALRADSQASFSSAAKVCSSPQFPGQVLQHRHKGLEGEVEDFLKSQVGVFQKFVFDGEFKIHGIDLAFCIS